MFSKSTSSLSSIPHQQQQPQLPDLSYLSEDERKIIEAVLERQKQDELNSLSIINKTTSIQNIKPNVESKDQKFQHDQHRQQQNNREHNFNKQSINDIAQEIKQRYGSIDTGTTCDICKKTKFVNGTGHQCFYCKLTCCVRCAVKLNTKNKQIWTCNQCKIKQHAILKSGQWLNNTTLNKCYNSDYVLNNPAVKSKSFDYDDDNNSIAGGVNTAGINANGCNNINNKNVKKYNFNNNTNQNSSFDATCSSSTFMVNNSTNDNKIIDNNDEMYLNNKNKTETTPTPASTTTTTIKKALPNIANLTNNKKSERIINPANLYKTYSRTNSIDLDSNDDITLTTDNVNTNDQNNKNNVSVQSSNDNNKKLSTITVSQQQQQINLSANKYNNNKVLINQSSIESTSTDIPPIIYSTNKPTTNEQKTMQQQQQQQHRGHKLMHNDSLSSDPSDCVPQRGESRQQIQTHHHHHHHHPQQQQSQQQQSQQSKQQKRSTNQSYKRKIKHTSKQHSLSSTDEDDEEDVDEEIRSTTEYTTGDEIDIESGSISEKGRSNLKKIAEYLDQNMAKEDILAAKMTKFLSPTAWKMSPDQKKLIGYITIKRPIQDGVPTSIGFKVVGGRPTLDGTLCAFIDKIKKGSLSDSVYHLKSGDEIVEWNNICLRGLTYDQVFNIMNKSKFDTQIELIVERLIDETTNQLDNELTNDQITSDQVIKTPTLSSYNNNKQQISSTTNICGKLETKLYYDTKINKLYATISNATIKSLKKQNDFTTESLENNNPNNTNNNNNNAFCELYLLPNKDENDKIKLTNIVKYDDLTRSFNWNETLIFDNVYVFDIKENLSLKIMIYSYPNKDILGQCKINLSKSNLNNDPQMQMLYYTNELSSNETVSTTSTYSRVRSSTQNNNNNNKKIIKINNNSNNDNSVLSSDLLSKTNQQMINTSNSDKLATINRPIDVNNSQKISTTTTTTSLPIKESSNESINTPKRRQLPQIPLDKQQVNRNKIAHELEEKARQIKHQTESIVKQIKTQEISQSDNESTINSTQKIPQQKVNKPLEQRSNKHFIPIEPAKDANNNNNNNENLYEISNNNNNNNNTNIGKLGLNQQRNINDSTTITTNTFNNQSNINSVSSLPIESTQQKPPAQTRLPSPTPKPVPIRSRSSGPNAPERFIVMRDLKDLKQKTSDFSSNKYLSKQMSSEQYDSYATPPNTNNIRGRDDFKPVYKQFTNTADFDSDGSEHSQFSSVSKISSNSVMSTQSEIPKGLRQRYGGGHMMGNIQEISNKFQSSDNFQQSKINNMDQTNYMQQKQQQSTINTNSTTYTTSNTNVQINSNYPTSSYNNSNSPSANTKYDSLDITKSDKKDGTLSDSALSGPATVNDNKKRRPSMAKALVILGLSKKSNSVSSLTTGKRLGFARSEEIGVLPELRNYSLNNENKDSVDSAEKKLCLWSGALKLPHEQAYSEFVDGLGPGQKVGRQVLGSPCLGEIQMSIFLDKGDLVVEIIRARHLKLKSGYRILPAPYVKLYLFEGRLCIAKQKSTVARRTLDPMYQEELRFQHNYRDKVLQVTVWGDYGKLDRKVFMGVAQIVLNELNLSTMVIGWYKLYAASSLMSDVGAILSRNSSVTNLSSTESGYSIDTQSVVSGTNRSTK